MVAHRANHHFNLENALQSFKEAYAAGVRWFETDVMSLSDGTLVIHHDETLDRTTTGTGNVISINRAAFKALLVDDLASRGPGYIPEPPLLLSELLDWAADKDVVLILEAKSPNSGDNMLGIMAELRRRNWPTHKIVLAAFVLSVAQSAKADGWRAVRYHDVGQYTQGFIDESIANGFFAVSWPYTAWTQPFVDAVKAAGLETWVSPILRRKQLAQMQALGVDKVFSGDTVYLSGKLLSTTDHWAAMKYMPGMIANHTDLPDQYAAQRGVMRSTGDWGYASGDTSYSTQMGFACPIKGNPLADDFTIECAFRLNSAIDVTKWVALWLCCQDDDREIEASYSSLAYRAIFRQDGRIGLFAVDASGNGVQIVQTAVLGAPLSLATRYYARAVVTPTTVTCLLLASDRTTVLATTGAQANTYRRGGYFSLGRKGCDMDWVKGTLRVS